MGYSPSFDGGMGTLLIMSGLVGAAISGLYVDKTGEFEKVVHFACDDRKSGDVLEIVVIFSLSRR